MKHLLNAMIARLRTPAGQGTMWTMVVFGGSQLLRLVSTLTLTRLLFPEAFGLMALVSVFLYGLEMITDAGIYQGIIRHERGTQPTYLNTAWSIQVIRGVSLFMCACLLAVPIAHLYDQPQLALLLPAAATSTLMHGFTSLSIPLANRRMEFAKPAILEISSAAISLVVTIAAAWWLRSVWAIAIGGFVGALLRLTGSYLYLTGPRFRFALDRESTAEILHFGKWIFASSLITFMAMQGDKLIFGTLIPLALLGSYSIAEQFSRLMRQIAEEISGRVVFPVLATAHRESPTDVRSLLASAQTWQTLLVLGSGVLGGLGTLLIDFLYDERYAAAGWMLQILCVKTAIASSTRAASNCLVATGHPYYGAAEQLATAVLLVIGVFASFETYGVLGVVWAVALAELGGYLVIQFGLVRNGYFSWRPTLLAYVMCAAGFLIGHSISVALQ